MRHPATALDATWQAAGDWRADADAIDLWLVSLDSLHDDDLRLLSHDERERADRRLGEARRADFVTARASLRRILARYALREARELRFEYGEHDKPSLVGDPFSFNLSHSRRLALVAVMESGRLGVDVEYQLEQRKLGAIAERWFARDEAAFWASRPRAAQLELFYRFWTCKEAYLKAWGTGLSFSSRRFAMELGPDGSVSPPQLVSTEMPGDEPGRLRFAELPPPEGYSMAVCWEGRERPLRLWRFER
jgi:4'-phosphopantetheinyl transferase